MNAIYVIDTVVNIAGPIGCVVCAVLQMRYRHIKDIINMLEMVGLQVQLFGQKYFS